MEYRFIVITIALLAAGKLGILCASDSSSGHCPYSRTSLGPIRHAASAWQHASEPNAERGQRQTSQVSQSSDDPVIPESGIVSDFESGKPVSPYGAGWSVFNDNEVGGESSAEISVVKEGAHRSKYALLVKGYIEDDISSPAAGAMFSPGRSLMAAADLSSKKSIVFWARGGRTGQTCQLALFSPSKGIEIAKRGFRVGPEWKKYSKRDIPSFITFLAGPEWRKYRFLFSQFPGVDQHQVTGILFSGGPSPGPFGFEIDDVQIR